MSAKKHIPHNAPYRAFLVRCWQNPVHGEEPPGEPGQANKRWTYIIVPIDDTARAQGCNNEQELIAYLVSELAAAPRIADQAAD